VSPGVQWERASSPEGATHMPCGASVSPLPGLIEMQYPIRGLTPPATPWGPSKARVNHRSVEMRDRNSLEGTGGWVAITNQGRRELLVIQFLSIN
jgi:hypothetical protein